MKRIEAETLEAAYGKAAKALNCSVTEINYEIVQHPTAGMMGMFKKPAIIIAVKKVSEEVKKAELEPNIKAEIKSEEIVINKRKNAQNAKILKTPKKKIIEEKETPKEKTQKEIKLKDDGIVDDFFTTDIKAVKEEKQALKSDNKSQSSEEIIFEDDRDTHENRERSIEIERKLQKLMKAGCFEIDTVEVDVFNGIAHIFLDGDDAALLIGKEGYRYNALSYMLFNWINAQYNLYIKLEIAEFIQAQEEMIDSYLKPIAEHIKANGRGKTKPLDGILVQIALEKLRVMFPNKYVAIKTGKDAKKFIIINDFNTRKPQ